MDTIVPKKHRRPWTASAKLEAKLLNTDEDAVSALIEHGRPLYGGMPSRLSLYLLKGLRQPVVAEQISAFKGKKITDALPAILASRGIMTGVEVVPGRRKYSYVTRESGLVVLRAWARKSHDFATYLEAYQPDGIDRILACREVDRVLKVGFAGVNLEAACG